MKGVVFTEFLELVEDKFGAEVVDGILDGADLESQGAYTAVGTYDHVEMLTLVGRLSEATGIEAGDLVKVFGEYLFARLAAGHSELLGGISTTEEMLRSVHDVIHVEVLKLYPKAELPDFKFSNEADGRLSMHYKSSRGFADLAEGLMIGCGSHFGESIKIDREDLSSGAGTDVKFYITLGAAA